MTDIRLVRAFCFSLDKEAQAMGFFETGMMSNGRVYFRNPYIEIPNEFKTCPQFYPRMLFSLVCSTIDGILNDHDSGVSQSTNWLFEIEYADGKTKTLRYSKRISSLMKLLNYNNLLSCIDTDWSTRNITEAPSKNLTLEKVRGEVALGVVTLPELLAGRLDLLLAGSKKKSIRLTGSGSLSISLLPAWQKRATTVIIDGEGVIQESGGILYTEILKEQGVKVLFDKDIESLHTESTDSMVRRARTLGFVDDYLDGTAFPSLPEEVRIMFLDPQYLITERNCSYAFANREEFQIFYRRYQSGGDVRWSQSTAYEDLYCEAYQYYDSGNYEKAVSLYKKCIIDNPIAIEARFELVNCYVRLEQYTYALIELAVLKELIGSNYFAAKFYRTLGYIYCEMEKYPLAYSCYMHSQKYDGTSEEVTNELIYIYRKAEADNIGKSVCGLDFKRILMDNNVPVITVRDEEEM